MKKRVWIAVLMGSSVFADPLSEGRAAFERHEYVKAVEAFERACNGGSAEGCYELGALVEKGTGAAQNPYRAGALYTAACRGGMAEGCSHMGINITP